MSDITIKNEPDSVEIPPILRNLLEREYNAETERIFAGFACRRPVTLRANSLKSSAEEVGEALAALGYAFERVPWYREAFILPCARERDLADTELYKEGKIYLQSLSSMLPPLLLGASEKETILDMTAAPGGKTTELFALSDGKALITACERDKIRFERLKFNLLRQEAGRVNAMCADASRLDSYFRFDKILLDAPCTGSGTFSGREPFSEKLLSGCMRSQKALLCKAISLLKKGGTLLYSTCSLLKEENEEMLTTVLEHSDARLVPLDAPFLQSLPRLSGREGTVTVCPDSLFEGFFLAKIVK